MTERCCKKSLFSPFNRQRPSVVGGVGLFDRQRRSRDFPMGLDKHLDVCYIRAVVIT